MRFMGEQGSWLSKYLRVWLERFILNSMLGGEAVLWDREPYVNI
jgi:hypothetical protein